MAEPCPFCGARVEPFNEFGMKRCPLCGGRWTEEGGFWASDDNGDTPYGGSGSGYELVYDG